MSQVLEDVSYDAYNSEARGLTSIMLDNFLLTFWEVEVDKNIIIA